jgi:membrane-associated phospholipid phosphatase
LDSELFHALHATLGWNEPWAYFWAQLNCRWFDACVGAVLIGAAAWSFRRRSSDEKLRAVVSLGLTGLFAILWQQFVSTQVIEKGFAYHRLSPSLVHAHAVRLSEAYPELGTKDASPWCFPSDHGFVLIVLAGYFALYGSRHSRLFFAVAGIALALPRLVVGAHWLTDFAVGSGAMALFFVGVFLATPLHDKLTGNVMLAWQHLRVSAGPRLAAARTAARPIVAD